MIRKYEGDDKTDRNKDMEILCATFLYEPYLYDQIAHTMPDVTDKIEEFVDALIFGNPKKNNKKINIKKELTFEWDKKDIVQTPRNAILVNVRLSIELLRIVRLL